LLSWFFFFFFQAEDGIRDFHVTGVQTCALPILAVFGAFGQIGGAVGLTEADGTLVAGLPLLDRPERVLASPRPAVTAEPVLVARSEERRVGKEGRPRWCAERVKVSRDEHDETSQ